MLTPVLSFVALSLALSGSALAEPAVRDVQFSEVAPLPPQGTADEYVLSWPFCPSDAPCTAAHLPAWVEMRISLPAYSMRLKDEHDDIARIVSMSYEDVAPIARALQGYLDGRGDGTLKSRAAWAQGLAQSIQYAYDSTTGFADYPKFALEFLVDQKGDCDDAAIFSGTLLEQLGLHAYFVDWDPLKGNTGHLSTAVEREGDLATVAPPSGSRLVERPNGPPLLHVDGVGSETGCRHGCGELGWNDWVHQGLRVAKVIGVMDPGLTRALHLRVIQPDGNGPLQRALSDRRNLLPSEIIFPPSAPADVEARERSQLQRMGLEEQTVELVVGRRWATSDAHDSAYWGLTGLVAGGLLLAGIGGVRAAHRRHAAARQRQTEKRRQAF